MWLLYLYIATVIVSMSIHKYEFHKRKQIRTLKGDHIETLVISLLPLANLFVAHIAISNMKYEINKALEDKNQLGQCGECGKLCRKYQIELNKLENTSTILCPHCKNANVRYSNIQKFKWQDTHPDCVKLDKRGLFKHINTLKEVDRLSKEINEIDSFREYCGL